MDIFIFRKSTGAALVALAGCFVLVWKAEIAVRAANTAIIIWIQDVVPALLPYFICVNFLIGTGVFRFLPSGLFPFAMSILSGYPMGSKIIGDLIRNGDISIDDGKRLLGLCSTSGPGFIVGTVGIGMFSSYKAGLIILSAHIAGAVVNYILLSIIFPKRESKFQKNTQSIIESDLSEKLTAAIISSFRSLAVILAYIVIFMFITQLISCSSLMENINNEILKSIINGFFEMTIGCSSLNMSGVSYKESIVAASVIISWGGMSVIGQCCSMLSGCGITLKYIMITKILHSIFAGITALFIVNIML